jgi:hypothetical protein
MRYLAIAALLAACGHGPHGNGAEIRMKAGPNSGSPVVNRIELCMQAT